MWCWTVVLLLLQAFSASNAGISKEALETHPLFKSMANNTNLSEIYKILELNDGIDLLGRPYQHAILFAPTNMAFQITGSKVEFQKDRTFLDHHIVLGKMAYPARNLPSELLSMVGDRLVITRTAKGDVYVNNAKILPEFSRSYDVPESHRTKVLYVIDDVLVPLRVRSSDGNSVSNVEDNPSAYGLLEKYNDYDLNNFQLSMFSGMVKQFNKSKMFRDTDRHNTYFIPVDSSFLNNAKGSMNDRIIDAHVVYDRALFVNPTPENEAYETAAFNDMAKPTVSFTRQFWGPDKKRHRYVSSNPKPGHPTGRVLSEIVYPNIPVNNGVVHLIQKPLMLVNKNIKELLDDPSLDPIISIFKEKLRAVNSRTINEKLNGAHHITLLIPSNEAWKDTIVERALNNTTFLENILQLHLIQDSVTTEKVRNQVSNEVPTLAKNKYLYLNLVAEGMNRTLTVEGGGVNATVLLPDIGAVNGVVHIIDRVLGIPYATVGKKVATDPELNFTYNLGKIPYDGGRYRTFNDKLDDPSKNYTYLVPRDAAWATLRAQYPKVHDALQQPGVAYDILERHLVEDRNFSMADLMKSSNQTYVLQTKNGGLNIKVKVDPRDHKSGYTIMWNGLEVGVFRPDVPCTNGFVHIIDRVLIRPEDLKIPVGAASKEVLSLRMLLLFVLPLGMMVLYH